MTLLERVERIERALDGEEQPGILVIRGIAVEADLRELPEESEQWLTWPAAWARREFPTWPGGVIIVHLDAEAERRARVQAAQGGKN